MSFFNFFKPHRYDMDSLNGINSIPVPAKNYNTGDPTKDCIYYVLQRKATEHHDKRMNDCLPPILFSAIFKLLKVLPDTELDAC